MFESKRKLLWMVKALLVTILYPTAVLADVLVYCLDISGSMGQRGVFDPAKAVLIQQIEAAGPGTVACVLAFDSNDYPLGCVNVGEDGSAEAKAQLIAKIRELRAKGRWTNIDECLQAAKALLLEERAPGARKIIVLSDGVSDPSPDHTQIDIHAISEMIPQELGWGVYLVGLPKDLEGIFAAPPQEMGIFSAPSDPNIKGIPLQQFSPEEFNKALTHATAVDVTVVMPPQASPPAAEPVKTELEEITPPVEPTTSAVPEQAPSPAAALAAPEPTLPEAAVPADKPFPVLWLLGAALLTVVGAASLFLPRRSSSPQRTAFTLEVQEGEEEVKQFPLTLSEGTKRTVGAKGDIPLSDPELPAIVCILHLNKGQLYLTPRDTISINGQAVTVKTPVGVGDRITVREKTIITINEGGVNL